MTKQRTATKARQPDERTVRWLARNAAGYIRRANVFFRLADEAAEGSDEQRRAMEEAKDLWYCAGVMVSCCSKPAKVLRYIAAVLGGTLKKVYREGRHDDKIEAALKAVTMRRVNGHWEPNLDASFADFKKELERKWGASPMPEDRSLRRTLKRRGSSLPGKRGRPAKK
jgi:hypothetical protein